MVAQKDDKRAAVPEPQEYPNLYKNLDPITPDLTVGAQKMHPKVIIAFGDVM